MTLPIENDKKPKNTRILILAVFSGLLFVSVFFFAFYGDFFTSKSEYDNVDIENTKIIEMFNTEIINEIDDHTKSDFNPGYVESSKQQTINFLSTIKSIESYARYGVTSKRPRNNIELKITFNNRKIVNEVYTGTSSSGYMEPNLLLKVFMENGKATKVLTNGIEKNGSPDWIVNDLKTLIHSSISYDIDKNHNAYFAPNKTQKDFDKEWKNK